MTLFENPDPWVAEARCIETDAEVFFPEPGYHAALIAKKICDQCEVVDQCLESALRRSERYGIWGSTTPRERQLIARKRRKELGGVRCTICYVVFKGSPQHKYCSTVCHQEGRRRIEEAKKRAAAS